MANLFSRISLICRSKVNALVDQFENPAEIIDQTIIDAKKEYADQVRQASEVFYNEKKVKKDLEDLIAERDKYNRIAERAVLAGNDDDATVALTQVGKLESKIKKQEERVTVAQNSADALRTKLDTLKSQIENMEGKAAEIKADMANAKAAEKASKVSGQINDSAFATFDRLAEKAEKERMKAESLNEYMDSQNKATENLEEKYSDGGNYDAAARLAEMKERLKKEQ